VWISGRDSVGGRYDSVEEGWKYATVIAGHEDVSGWFLRMVNLEPDSCVETVCVGRRQAVCDARSMVTLVGMRRKRRIGE